MHDNLVISLLHKQLTDQLESADKQLLLDWLANSKENVRLQKELTQIWDLSKNYEPSFTPNVNKGFEKFSQRIKNVDATPNTENVAKVIPMNPFKAWMKYAAVAVVLLGSVMVWQFTQNATVENLMASTIDNEIKNIDLADGSRVWLNEKSSLNYPDKFNSDSRVVTLEGEAFFDIRNDEKAPFIIKGGAADIKVIGTSFTFNTDNGEGLMEVEVKEGIVELIPVGSSEKLVLTKNEKGYFDKINKKFLVKEIIKSSNADYFVTGKYSFIESKYKYVFGILEKVYDVKFEFDQPGLKNCTLTSPLEFDRENISITLEILERAYQHRNLKFNKINDSKYSISSDTCD